jgi:hypothetical protein
MNGLRRYHDVSLKDIVKSGAARSYYDSRFQAPSPAPRDATRLIFSDYRALTDADHASLTEKVRIHTIMV